MLKKLKISVACRVCLGLHWLRLREDSVDWWHQHRYKPDLLRLCDCLCVFAVMGWLCTSTGPLSHLFLFPAICCFLPNFFLFLYLGCTTANIICVLLSSYNLSVSQKSYNLNEWGNFFCSNHSIFFWKNSCICNTVHACSVFLDGDITNCHLSFIKKYKGFEHKETILKKQ